MSRNAMRKGMKGFIWMIMGTALLACCISELSAQTLSVGAPQWRPYHIIDGEVLTGITPDLLRIIAKRTGFTIKIEAISHNRMMRQFKLRQIDIEPMVTPVWRKEQEDISVYTIPIIITQDIILVRKASAIKGTSVGDFKGLTLGCGLGYYYPEGFQEAFENGDILREDNRISAHNLKKLAFKRINGIIIDRIQAEYLFKIDNMNWDDFEIAYQFQPSKLSFRLHKSKKSLLPTLNAAIQSMIADGTIDEIVMRYTR